MLKYVFCLFFFKQKTAYEMRISDWSSDVCSSDLFPHRDAPGGGVLGDGAEGGKVSALPSGSLRDAALAAAVALTGWQGLVWATGVPAFILPGPLRVGETLVLQEIGRAHV